MNWNDAHYFLAIARAGQMLGAARRMQVSQARLSRHLQSLEDTLGTRLFDRSTRGCVLTDDGRAFLLVAERMEAAALSVSARLGGTDTPAGTVRIGAPDGFGSAFLAPRLGALADAFPRLHVQLVPLPRHFSLSEREADLAIMVGRPARGRLRARKLSNYTLGLYAARAYLDRVGPVGDLAGHRLVGYVADLLHTPELDYAEELAPGHAPDIEISTAIGQFEAVRAGAGIGALHDFMATAASDLVPVLPERRAERSYWAVWHENLAGSRKIAAVVDFLSSEIQMQRSAFHRPTASAP